jgi:hypothetical protein
VCCLEWLFKDGEEVLVVDLDEPGQEQCVGEIEREVFVVVGRFRAASDVDSSLYVRVIRGSYVWKRESVAESSDQVKFRRRVAESWNVV